MCTLTFSPVKDGFLIGMNRDEQRSRPTALPPETFARLGVQAMYPREAGGGTWIACSSHGNSLALLNWYSAKVGTLSPKLKTRGSLIPELIFEADSHSVENQLNTFDLGGMHPFRLFGAFHAEKLLCEWRWNGYRVERTPYPWLLRHWFSSSLSDSSAEQSRGRTCAAAAVAANPPTREWLAALHRSHHPEPGPYSVCVHRPDAATVSYTEVECCGRSLSMGYLAGSPCEKSGLDLLTTIPLGSKPSLSARS